MCREKSNEIISVPRLLDKVDVSGNIVTADAMSFQKAIIDKIRKKGGDFLIELKANPFPDFTSKAMPSFRFSSYVSMLRMTGVTSRRAVRSRAVAWFRMSYHYRAERRGQCQKQSFHVLAVLPKSFRMSAAETSTDGLNDSPAI